MRRSSFEYIVNSVVRCECEASARDFFIIKGFVFMACMQPLVTQEDAYPVTCTSEQCRGSVIHLDDGIVKSANKEADGLSQWIQANSWESRFSTQPEFIPQELTSVSVQQPMSLDDPYSAVDGCSMPSEIIVELADSQPVGGLDIEAYKPRVAKSRHRFATVVDRQQKTRGSRPVEKSGIGSTAAPSAKPQKHVAPCNTSQALDITDLSTDVLSSSSLRAPFKNSNASIRLAYFKHKKPSSGRVLSASGSETVTAYLDRSSKRSSHFKSSRVITSTKPDVSYITMNIPYAHQMSASRSPRTLPSKERPSELSIKGRTLSYNDQLTPNRKGKALKEADLLTVTASHGKLIRNPLNDELLSLTHPFSNYPLYRSALYTGNVKNLYVQENTNGDCVETKDYDNKHLQRLMRPTISSAGKVSTYAKYRGCTDLVRNLPLEGDDYAHPDNNVSSYIEYRIDTQLHIGADKVPLPANSMSTTDRILNEILAEQAEERNAHIRLLSRSGQRRPRSAPLQVAVKDDMDSRSRRPKSAILAFLSEARTVETTIYKEGPSMSPEVERKVTSRDLYEESQTAVTHNDSFPSLIMRNSFPSTPSPKNHILAIKKSNSYRNRQKYDYTGEECSSMDQFSGEMEFQRQLRPKRGLNSATTHNTTLQLSGHPTGREITTPLSARPSQKRPTFMETDSYGSIISPQTLAGTTNLAQSSPCKEVSRTSQAPTKGRGAAQKKRVVERIRQLTSPDHLQDICITDKDSEYVKCGSLPESPQITPLQVIIKMNQRQASSDPRPWSSLQKRHAESHVSDPDVTRPQSADLSENYERSLRRRLNDTVSLQNLTDLPNQALSATPVFVPTLPVLHQPPTPDRPWKQQGVIGEKGAVQETKISTERRSTVTSYTTNFSNLTCLTSKTGSSWRSTTFLQGHNRGRVHYFNSHSAGKHPYQHGNLIIGRGTSTVQVPYGGLVSPHKNCFLAQIDEEERFAYAKGQYTDPTGLARSVQLATNLGGHSQK